MKKAWCMILALGVLVGCLAGCAKVPASPGAGLSGSEENAYPDARVITLSGHSAALDGTAVEEFDYTWHCDPSVSHDQVKNAPAEYYTGAKPETDAAVYIDQALFYFPALEESGFTLEAYDGEQEWTYRYTDGQHEDYLFGTLPKLGNALPTQMMHTAAEAAENRVLHITQPGTYVLEGTWQGQVWVDLGDEDETFTDPTAKVTLILNGVDITCTVAPGVVFRSAYECDNTWADRENWSADVDTTDAGVQVMLAEGTENTVSGTNVYRMLKTVYKDETSTDPVKVQKKLRKTDAAFYSYVTMNITGSGSLTVNSGFEGLDSELHLTILDGEITVNSQDDGINVNEDHVSVISFDGGTVNLNAAQGAEGDGVDSNGYIALRGGSLNVNGVRPPDSAMDSEDGIVYESGAVTIDGEAQTYTPGETFRETGGIGGGKPGMGDRPAMPGAEDFDLVKFKEDVATLEEDATLEDVLALLGLDMGWSGGPGGTGQGPEGIPQPPAEHP